MNKTEMDALQKIFDDARDKHAPAPKYPIYKRLPPAFPELHNKMEEIQREIAERCHKLEAMGYEPFLEFTYGEDGLVKTAIVRPHRPEDND